MSWFGEKSTLLPDAIFKLALPEEVYALSFGIPNPNTTIEFNRIPGIDIVNVYDIPNWIKQFFTSRFGKIQILHEGSHALKTIFDKLVEKPNIYVFQHQKQFLLLAVKDNNLHYYNIFDHHGAEDIIYHTAHLIQK